MRFFRRPIFNALSILALTATAFAQAPAAGRVEKITLDEAIQRALAKNFSIRVSSFDAAISGARLTEALGKFDPVISGTYNHSESENPQLINPGSGLRPGATGSESDSYDLSLNGLLPTGMTYQLGATSSNARGTFNAFADNYSTFAGISARQPLLRDAGFGPTLATVRIAKTNRNISDWQFKQTIMDTITRVIFAYNDLNFARANLRSVRRSRDLAASLLDDNEKRYRIGSMSEYDVTSARSRVVSREEGILFAERAALDSENFLKQLITDERQPHLLDLHFEIAPPPPAPIVVVDPAVDFRTALQKRPDYQQALLNVQRSGISFRLQRNQVLPRVDLVGSYGYSGNDRDFGISRQQVRDEDFRSFSYGAVVTIPLTFTTERGRYRAAKLQLRQSETSLQSLEQEIVVRVGNAAGQIETTQKRVETARRARELAQQTLDSEVKRLRAGTGSTFFVAQQQEIVSDLETREYRAQSDHHKALAEYDRQLGVTLEKTNVTMTSFSAK